PTSALGFITVSRLNGWPIRSPTDASPTSSRTPAHGSGATWIATPSSQWTFTTYSLPVSPGALTRVTACTLALSPIRDTHSEGFSHFVTSMTAPVASGWSDCRVGFAPTGKRRLLTAHTLCGTLLRDVLSRRGPPAFRAFSLCKRQLLQCVGMPSPDLQPERRSLPPRKELLWVTERLRNPASLLAQL